MIDGATPAQRFRHITMPMLMPILAVVLTFSVIFTFTDFQLVYAITRGGPVNSTHLMATLAYQRAIPGGQLGEGAAIAVRSEEHTSELQSRQYLVCRLLLEKKKKK